MESGLHNKGSGVRVQGSGFSKPARGACALRLRQFAIFGSSRISPVGLFGVKRDLGFWLRVDGNRNWVGL